MLFQASLFHSALYFIIGIVQAGGDIRDSQAQTTPRWHQRSDEGRIGRSEAPGRTGFEQMAMDIVNPSSAPDRDAVRAKLTQERNEILLSVEARHGEVEDGPSGVSDGSGETEHLTTAEVKELSQHLDRIASEALAEIEAALARLDDGTYGKCVACGEEISTERLDALPAAARCIDCQTGQG